MDVVADQAPVVPQFAGGQQGQQRVEVAGGGAFADLDQEAEGGPARPSSAVVASWSERMPAAA